MSERHSHHEQTAGRILAKNHPGRWVRCLDPGMTHDPDCARLTTKTATTTWGALTRVWPALLVVVLTTAAVPYGHAQSQVPILAQAQAQTPRAASWSPSTAPHMASLNSATPLTDDVDLADYMQALSRLSPAAADGATAFMQAFLARCGRPMRTLELRRAVAQDAGDPVLMQMIRAAYEHDAAASLRLAGQVDCGRYGIVKRVQGGGK